MRCAFHSLSPPPPSPPRPPPIPPHATPHCFLYIADVHVRRRFLLQATAASLADVARPAAAESLRACLARRRWDAAAFDTPRWVAQLDDALHMMWESRRRALAGGVKQQRLKLPHVLVPAPHVYSSQLSAVPRVT